MGLVGELVVKDLDAGVKLVELVQLQADQQGELRRVVLEVLQARWHAFSKERAVLLLKRAD